MYRASREAAAHRAEAALSRLRERGGEGATEGRFVDDTLDETQLAELTAWAEAVEARLQPAAASAPPGAKKLKPSEIADRRFGEALDRALTLERKIRQARPDLDRAAQRLAIAPEKLELVRPRLGDVKTSARAAAARALLAECERMGALLQRLESLLEKKPPVVTPDAFQVEAKALTDASFRATRTPGIAHVATWSQPWKWIVAGFAGPPRARGGSVGGDQRRTANHQRVSAPPATCGPVYARHAVCVERLGLGHCRAIHDGGVAAAPRVAVTSARIRARASPTHARSRSTRGFWLGPREPVSRG